MDSKIMFKTLDGSLISGIFNAINNPLPRLSCADEPRVCWSGQAVGAACQQPARVKQNTSYIDSFQVSRTLWLVTVQGFES